MQNKSSTPAHKDSTKIANLSAEKTSISPRESYLREKELIKNEIGDLEQIRMSLGLSQRRMCQLLLVDPSAWTRWSKMPEGAPPHVYQALRWLVQLRKIDPDAAAPSNIATRVDFIQSTTNARIKELENNIGSLERSLGMAVTAQPAHERNYDQEIADLNAKIALLMARVKKVPALKEKNKISAKKSRSKKSSKNNRAANKKKKVSLKLKNRAKIKSKPKPKPLAKVAKRRRHISRKL